ncbi:hypothetical protein [Arsenophonus sp. PmNCSU2021_1]|uniref:hypothetical protein n=1 Tax=Arsenophonus sp. PmNCSU2021_1 TaxID=3118989 RepID=UPI002FEF17FC
MRNSCQNPIDLAFEGIFWPQVQRKVGKQSAKSAFKTQFKLWRKETGETAARVSQSPKKKYKFKNKKKSGCSYFVGLSMY